MVKPGSQSQGVQGCFFPAYFGQAPFSLEKKKHQKHFAVFTIYCETELQP